MPSCPTQISSHPPSSDEVGHALAEGELGTGLGDYVDEADSGKHLEDGLGTMEVHERQLVSRGRRVLPRASAEHASIHGANLALSPAPARAGRSPNTTKANVARAASAKEAIGNQTCGAVLACMSLTVSLTGLYLGPCHNSVTTHPAVKAAWAITPTTPQAIP
jgi:hypothetical protein